MKIGFNVSSVNKNVNGISFQYQRKNVSFGLSEYEEDCFCKLSCHEKGTYEWALHWNEDERKKELDEEFEKAKKGMSWWKRSFTYALDELKATNKKTIENEKLMVNTLLRNSVRFQNQYDYVNEQMDIINKRKIQLEKLDKASKIIKSFEIDNEGGIDDSIAGYDSEKQIIRESFIDRIALEKAGVASRVPNGILFYGPIATGKTVMARAAAREAGARLVEINPDSSTFIKVIDKKLKEAKKRYLQDNQRTVILINEIDAYLKELQSNEQNITKMKSWLDNAAQLPTEEMGNAYATTFIFTTNSPLSITNKILFRDEKLDKTVSFEPASNGNIEEIIKFYLDKMDENGLVTEDENINYDKIIKLMNPDDERGAFGTDAIKRIINKAFVDFDKDVDRKKSLEEHLIERIKTTKRNISPNDLQEFKVQMEEIYED